MCYRKSNKTFETTNTKMWYQIITYHPCCRVLDHTALYWMTIPIWRDDARKKATNKYFLCQLFSRLLIFIYLFLSIFFILFWFLLFGLVCIFFHENRIHFFLFCFNLWVQPFFCECEWIISPIPTIQADSLNERMCVEKTQFYQKQNEKKKEFAWWILFHWTSCFDASTSNHFPLCARGC